MIRLSAIIASAGLAISAVQAAPVLNVLTGVEYDVISAGGISWADANASVASGWHLATITDAAEQAFVEGLITGGTEWWLGGYQDPTDGGVANNWHWVTGEAFTYTNWTDGEPNDANAPGENHLGIWGPGGAWGWNDESYLGNVNGYVVERSVVPEPGTMALMGLGLLGLVAVTRRRRA